MTSLVRPSKAGDAVGSVGVEVWLPLRTSADMHSDAAGPLATFGLVDLHFLTCSLARSLVLDIVL